MRSCFAPDTHATLYFDPDKAVAPIGAPSAGPVNTLTTTDPSSADRTFDQTVLDPIQHLPHDHLSQLDFPGPQRLRNFMLLARPVSGPLAGQDALVVVSLLASEGLELRVIARSADGATSCPGQPETVDAGAVDDQADAGEMVAPVVNGRYEYFGLWRMRRER